MAIEEINKEELLQPVTKRNTERILRIFSAIITVFLIATLVIIKINKPEFPLLWIFIIGGFILIVGTLVFFIFTIVRKFKENKNDIKGDNKLPKPATLPELQRIAENALVNKHYANHLRSCKGEKWFTVGKKVKNIVYVYKSSLLYTDDIQNEVFIMINAHYPNDRRCILINPAPSEFNRALQGLGTDPEDEPDIEEVTEKSPLTGIERTTKKVIHKKEDDKKEEHKEEDL